MMRAFPQREQRENNPFPKEKQFSGLFFLDANIANALCFNMLYSSIFLCHRQNQLFDGKVNKSF